MPDYTNKGLESLRHNLLNGTTVIEERLRSMTKATSEFRGQIESAKEEGEMVVNQINVEELNRWAGFGFYCLDTWREARGEPDIAISAVAFSILNRVERPSWWGRTLMGVIRKKWQYSSMTAPGDPQLILYPTESDKSWQNVMVICRKVICGMLVNPVKGADSYFDLSIKAPDWTKDARFVGQYGRLKFYDVDHDYEVEVTHLKEA